MKKSIIYYCLFITVLVTSCGKEISVETGNGGPATGNGNGTGTGNGNGTGTQTGGGNFMPDNKGTWWKYKSAGTFVGTNTITSKGEKRTVNGIPCTVFTSSATYAPGDQEGFFGSQNHQYYAIQKGVSPNTGATFDLSFLYLNDTASVGYTWEHAAGSANGITAYTPGAIVEKGITVNVEGKEYKDVTHTRTDLQYDIPMLGKITFATYDYYIAKNIGIIRIRSTGDAVWGGGISSDMTLLDYSIK